MSCPEYSNLKAEPKSNLALLQVFLAVYLVNALSTKLNSAAMPPNSVKLSIRNVPLIRIVGLVIIVLLVGLVAYSVIQPHRSRNPIENTTSTYTTTSTYKPTSNTSTTTTTVTTTNTTTNITTTTNTSSNANTSTTPTKTTISTTSLTNTTTRTTTTTTGRRLLDYGAKVQSLSYGNINSATWPEVENELALLKEMGVSYYAIHLNYDPWLQNKQSKIDLVDQAVQWIRDNGGKVHIVNSCCESLRNSPVPFDKFSTLMLNSTSEWSRRYHPDALTVIKESGWYLPFISDWRQMGVNTTVLKFKTLGFELTSEVKSISPDTKTVYAEITDALIKGDETVILFNDLLKDPNLDVVGLDIYGYKCGADTKTPYLESTVSSITNASKSVWITETWATPLADMGSSCSNQAEAETTWAQHISDYAINKGIQVVTWFYTQRFGTIAQPSPTYLGIQNVMQRYD